MSRQEAMPLKFEELSDTQKQAAEDIAGTLLRALEDLETLSQSCDATDDDIDRFRASRNFFVSGEPGSGKTTVYLTLRELLRNSKAETPEHPFLTKLRQEKASQLRWLEPLDLEPMAESTNFLAAVLVRIAATLDPKGKAHKPEKDRRPGLLEDKDALQDLNRLQSDVVLAWEGTVNQRAEHVDPEVFAQDVLRAERARLSVNQRLRNVLSRLSGHKEERPFLYVLPVDDFYLKPDSSLQFLRLLRMISVPQLFILVLGDLDVVTNLFNLDMLGQLVRLSGERSLENFPARTQILTSRASALTSHAMRKLIPPSQRSFLQVMYYLQALEFRPQRPQARKNEQPEDTLSALLFAIPLRLSPSLLPSSKDTRLNPQNLREFLLLRKPETEKKDDFYTYSGLAILDLPPREVVDLYLGLERLKGSTEKDKEERWEATLRLVVDQTVEALEHMTYLDLESKERCREAIQGTPYYRRLFYRDALDVQPKLGTSRKIAMASQKSLSLYPLQAWVIRPRWDANEARRRKSKANLRNYRPLRDGSGGIDYLAPRPTAWFTVLHDLMALTSEDRMEGSPLIDPAHLGWVVVTAGRSEKKWQWPAPKWPAFRHFDMLAYRWRKVLDKLDNLANKTEEEVRPWLVYIWLGAITEILRVETWDPERSVPELHELQWESLKTANDALLDQVGIGGHYEVIEDWLLRLNVFLHEDFAIPKEVIDTLSTDKLKTFWTENQDRIEDLRASMIPKDAEKSSSEKEFQLA